MEEDEALKMGGEKHGNDWEKIIETESEVLRRRTANALDYTYYNKIKL